MNVQENLKQTILKINILSDNSNEDYDDLFLVPSEESINLMTLYVQSIANLPEYVIPSFSPDGKKGIEANWNINGKYLQLIISNDEDPYIFHKQGSNFKIEKSIAYEEFKKWFKWMIN